MTGTEWVLLAIWGTMVGVDLIAAPQIMIARPLVAGTIAGWLVGDIVAGAGVGAILELFAWEVLPVGTARYPDYGVGAVTATAVASGAPAVFGWGLAVAAGLLIAAVGAVSIGAARHLNTAAFERHRHEVLAGNEAVLVRLHLGGLVREVGRAAALTGLGLGLAAGLLATGPSLRTTVALVTVAGGVALGTGAASAVRLGAPERTYRFLYGGILGGVLWVLLV